MLAGQGKQWAAALGAVVVFGQSGAQSISDAEVIRQQEQQQQEMLDRASQARDVFTDTSAGTAGPLSFPAETPCFPIQRLTWQGAEPFSWLEQTEALVAGQCLGAQGLRLFQDHLSRELIERGFITSRVLIPEQNLTAGTLAIHILAGRMGEIRHEGKPVGFIQLALPGGAGDLLNQRDLDQGLENIRRLGSQHEVKFDLVPGAQLGETDIVVKHPETRRWRGLISLDDSGADATGKYQLGAVLALDSPLHLYDTLTVALNQNANHGNDSLGTSASSLSWSMPVGYWSFSLGASQSKYKQTVAGFAGDIEYRGRSYALEAGIGYVPYRTTSSKGALHFKLNRKLSRSRIDDTEIEVQYRNVVGFDLGFQHRQYLGPHTLDLGMGVRGSLPKHSDAPGIIIGTPGWDGKYRVFSAHAGLNAPFQFSGSRLRYSGSSRIQKTNTPLPSTEYFSIGNRYTTRGFDGASTLAAEEGWLLRNEVAWIFPSGAHELFLALDRGGVRGPQAALLTGRQLTGAALGVRGRIKQANYELTLGSPVKKPEGFNTESLAVTVALVAEF